MGNCLCLKQHNPEKEQESISWCFDYFILHRWSRYNSSLNTNPLKQAHMLLDGLVPAMQAYTATDRLAVARDTIKLNKTGLA
ncbi:hypothetical protein EUGRSUZ_C04374 [Eucalyptus grandis]|uniref:Uncharacterized protein n=2 Tax=Eucalyptus grandis TaxID=71139 RepID=A0ACC3LKP4_EUCGR|nr:hypothetical protein EUGRSUZ_C04374 [Eucalyptus grandis]